MPLEYRILGPLEIARDGEPVAVSAPKERLLLQLLLHANERVSVERLEAALWEEPAPPSALKLLQLYVSNLRKALGRDAITTAAGAYRIDVAVTELDSLRFHALLAEGRAARARSASSHVRCSRASADALARQRGRGRWGRPRRSPVRGAPARVPRGAAESARRARRPRGGTPGPCGALRRATAAIH